MCKVLERLATFFQGVLLWARWKITCFFFQKGKKMLRTRSSWTGKQDNPLNETFLKREKSFGAEIGPKLQQKEGLKPWSVQSKHHHSPRMTNINAGNRFIVNVIVQLMHHRPRRQLLWLSIINTGLVVMWPAVSTVIGLILVGLFLRYWDFQWVCFKWRHVVFSCISIRPPPHPTPCFFHYATMGRSVELLTVITIILRLQRQNLNF